MMLRRLRITRLLLGAALAFGVVVGAWFVHQIRRAQLSNSILTKIDILALYPPNDTPELQWAVLVYWTHNLHGNSIPHVYASYSSLRELDRFLDASLAEGPRRRTIDGLWDRYAAISDSGSRYRATYEPIRDSIADSVAAEGIDYFDARSYQDFLAHVRSSSPR
jgi:hypothetical protein